MEIESIIWLKDTVDKLIFKYGVEVDEVEELFVNRPRIRVAQKGDQLGEDVYVATGQTDAGRYLIVFFIYKVTQDALVLSARDMTRKERTQHGRKRA
jgi:uncharacterized protein